MMSPKKFAFSAMMRNCSGHTLGGVPENKGSGGPLGKELGVADTQGYDVICVCLRVTPGVGPARTKKKGAGRKGGAAAKEG